MAEGTQAGAILHATAVEIVPPHVAGTVIAVNGGAITISPMATPMDAPGARVTTVVTSGSTSYRGPGNVPATVATGDTIIAEGTLSADGTTLQARRIFVLPAGSGPGMFGRHMFRRGPMDGPAMDLSRPASTGPSA